MKGNFDVEEYGKVKLFVRTDRTSFLYVETTQQRYFLNLESEEMTKALYKVFVENTKK